MLVTVLTVGSRGDVQPLVALGVRLLRAGYEVRVATHAEFEAFVRARGLGFAAVEGNPREVLESEEGRAWIESRPNPLALMRRFLRLAAPRAERMLATSWEACRGSDAIVWTPLGFAGYHIAERLRIRSGMAALQPFTRTRELPATTVRPRRLPRPLERAYNVASHVLTEQVTWQLVRERTNAWRREALDLPPMPLRGPYRTAAAARYPILYGFSRHVVPRPSDWPPWLAVTGYWFLEPDPSWRPPEALRRFLEAGPPPVYVGFGSMTDRDPASLTRLVIEAAGRAGQRLVMLSGWSGLGRGELPEWAHVVGEVPHEWLFPRVRAVVHHGGAGTTAAGLRAGVPTVVVPSFADQHFWGDRVARCGAGPEPIPRRELTPDRLADAVHRAVASADLRERAAAVGEAIRGEDGTAAAVVAFERLVLGRRAQPDAGGEVDEPGRGAPGAGLRGTAE